MSTVLRASPPPRAARPIPRGRPVEGHVPSPHGFPVLRSISVYRHAVVNTPVARWVLIARGTAYSNRFPVPRAAAAFPIYLQGRRPHWTFRGLLNVHWRLRPVGSPSRQSDPSVSKAPTVSVTSTAAPIATGWSDPVAGWELHPLKTNTSRFTAHRYGVPGTPMRCTTSGRWSVTWKNGPTKPSTPGPSWSESKPLPAAAWPEEPESGLAAIVRTAG